ncbi:hypothetical protein [Flavobacterium microcysteis]|uniref:Nuclear transport factor 2 family protein n=1 Tax=Flavobacterium microcysteis TaxID=2596891 RepID=A0A501Q3G8_9FLAO|nr:hypothetical protein [Flavobacterium microcysteis]TPD66882.1 hypothetical protein FJA49_11385 [Flavobacterium microcysteis]
MKTQIKDAEIFFKNYEKRFNATLKDEKIHLDATIASFADCFIESSPLGVICGKNDSEFKKRMSKGYEFYKKIGITSMDILSKEIVALNEYHTMAKIYWRTNYQKEGKVGKIEFEVIYFLHYKDKKHAIFAYITGDEEKALKDHGLV